jgi:hypothetical protein
MAITPAVLPATAHALGAVSFWLTVALAATGSVLSAFCIYDPMSQPRRDPYSFIGQWFIWTATPLFWGIIAASLSFSWFKPLDLFAVLFTFVIARWSAHAICNLKWRSGNRRISDFHIARGRHRSPELGR